MEQSQLGNNPAGAQSRAGEAGANLSVGLCAEDAIQRAFQLGQTYWQQADSESYSQNKKADLTLAKFRELKLQFAGA